MPSKQLADQFNKWFEIMMVGLEDTLRPHVDEEQLQRIVSAHRQLPAVVQNLAELGVSFNPETGRANA